LNNFLLFSYTRKYVSTLFSQVSVQNKFSFLSNSFMIYVHFCCCWIHLLFNILENNVLLFFFFSHTSKHKSTLFSFSKKCSFLIEIFLSDYYYVIDFSEHFSKTKFVWYFGLCVKKKFLPLSHSQGVHQNFILSNVLFMEKWFISSDFEIPRIWNFHNNFVKILSNDVKFSHIDVIKMFKSRGLEKIVKEFFGYIMKVQNVAMKVPGWMANLVFIHKLSLNW